MLRVIGVVGRISGGVGDVLGLFCQCLHATTIEAGRASEDGALTGLGGTTLSRRVEKSSPYLNDIDLQFTY